MKLQNKFVLQIVKPSIKYNKTLRWLILFLILSMILNAVVCLLYNNLCTYTVILVFIFLLFTLGYSYIKKDYDYVGKIVLDDNRILLNEEIINIEEIDSIEFNFVSVSGDLTIFLAIKSGSSNTFYIKVCDGRVYRLNILINKESEFLFIKRMLWLYKSQGCSLQMNNI